MQNFINKFIISEYKFKYFFFSVISGILLALSFQKFNIFPFAWFALIPLVFCLEHNGIKKSLSCSFAAGFVFNLILAYWMLPFLLNNSGISDSVTVSLLSWLYLTAYFVIWMVLSAAVKKYLKPVMFALFVSSLWTVLELLKTYIFTGLPWNLLGYSQYKFTVFIQSADLFGIYFISFLIVFVNMMLFYWIYKKNKNYLIAALTLFCIVLFYGFIKLNISYDGNKDKLKIGIAQLNIIQEKKWNIRHKDFVVEQIYKCAEYFKDKKCDMILYPETSLPRRLEENTEMQNMIKDISSFSKNTLIGGMSVVSDKQYNSVFNISHDGKISGIYRKQHLVIFGEYIPFQFLLSKLLVSLNSNGGITKGESVNPVNIGKYSAGTNICSENFYPYLSRHLTLNGANILTNHTNDAWFDGMSELYQHFVMNVFRAVENRKYLAVSANTGISGIIDPHGRIVKQTNNMEQVCFTEEVYPNSCITIYDKIGDSFVYVCLCFVMIVLIYVIKIKLKDFKCKQKSAAGKL